MRGASKAEGTIEQRQQRRGREGSRWLVLRGESGSHACLLAGWLAFRFALLGRSERQNAHREITTTSF